MALPSGYTQGDYVGLTGSQYFDTGLKGGSTTRVVMDFELTDIGGARYIFGARTLYGTVASERYDFFWSNNQYFVSASRSTSINFSGDNLVAGLGRHKIDKNRGTNELDGILRNLSVADFTTSYNMYLGTVNQHGSPISDGMIGKIYSCKIYANNFLVRDFVPCRAPDKSIGLYDLVNGVFYGNNGSGEVELGGAEIKQPVGYVNIRGSLMELTGKGLINKGGILCPITTSSKVNVANVLKSLLIGEEVKTSRLPDGYTEVEYIQSTGTQYINTGVSPTTSLKTEITITPTSGAMSEHGIFGSTWAINGYFLMFYQNMLRWHSRGASVDISSFNTADKNDIICTPTGITVNGKLYNISGTQSDSTNAITLFGGISGYAGAVNGKFKLYTYKMYNGSTLVRDFVPCKNSSGAAGLYDLVNDKFYGNNGTGSFTAGAEV